MFFIWTLWVGLRNGLRQVARLGVFSEQGSCGLVVRAVVQKLPKGFNAVPLFSMTGALFKDNSTLPEEEPPARLWVVSKISKGLGTSTRASSG